MTKNDFDIFIDFDRTIYDTDKLYNKIYEICYKYGLSKNIINCCIEECFEEPVLFNFIELLKYISSKYNILSNVMIKEVEVLILQHGNEFVFDDFYSFIDLTKKHFKHIYLITYGDRQFQNKKINGSKIKKYFNNIIVTNNYKWQNDIFTNRKMVIIEDNPREIKAFKNKFPNSILVELKRDGTKYSKELSGEANIVLNNLSINNFYYELENIIFNNQKLIKNKLNGVNYEK